MLAAILIASVQAPFAIAAGYAIGQWVCLTVAMLLGRDAESRAWWRDLGGAAGGSAVFAWWLSAVI